MTDRDQNHLPQSVNQTGVQLPIPEIGMALAIKDKISSDGPMRAKMGWGGARNRRDRTSCYLSRKQCEGLIEAAQFAELIGLGFNRHWTVHYEKAGIVELDAPQFIGHLLKLVRDYARPKADRFTALWVRESGEGKGGHVHILMHLPLGRTMRGRTCKWIRLAGGTSRAGVSHVVSIAGRLAAADNGSEHYRHNLAFVLGYVLKCADIVAGEALTLRRFGERAYIIGKRCGSSQNIGSRSRLASRAIAECL
ncbi:MAG: hypothetical protein B7Y89_16975 [Novosphingobium sp. 32-60-15]|uniref:hypothetical protein n=1 Tax=unclassified Novosphingobium TaxID=2644732 RepID=UPI000BD2022E|nr:MULTISPECIES: hypothetical protein [unclassified Novosphingobium]OYX60116.1 MAG: hypothetical protein B7Y89_16975 [Novosphingobium sp. 32-60-15]